MTMNIAGGVNGGYSFAAGIGSVAEGRGSVAIGDHAEAIPPRTVALGDHAKAPEAGDVAIGPHLLIRADGSIVFRDEKIDCMDPRFVRELRQVIRTMIGATPDPQEG